MSSPSNHNTNNTRSVTLAPFFLVLSLKICFILKSLIRGMLLFKLIWWLISLIPPIRLSVFKRYALLAISISLNKEIMSLCSCYIKKGLVYIIIIDFSGRQPSFYAECTKLNTYILYNMRLVSLNKYAFFCCARYYTY